VAREAGTPAYRVDGPGSIDHSWLEHARVVGVTAGASAPDQSVRAVIDAIAPEHGVDLVSVTEEGEYFPPPPQLRAFLSALQSAVEGGVAARNPGRPGALDDDRAWDAARALDLLGVEPTFGPAGRVAGTRD
jgi:4-hydroxy-3-methylbut-2-enyl diphosphate reductase